MHCDSMVSAWSELEAHSAGPMALMLYHFLTPLPTGLIGLAVLNVPIQDVSPSLVK